MSELTEFIKKYGKSYDPETNDYDVPPFQKNIDNASKSSKIYNMHMYWTKQDPYVVKQYIEHYTKPGDIVLDAFCGTGMTGVAAMMCGRHAILLDISPACIHIARNYTTPIDPNVLYKAYQELKAKVEPEIKPLYKTKCHNCGNPNAQIANTILSDVYKCPRCGEDVLYAGNGRWERMKRGEKFRKIRCGNCGYEFSKAKAEFVRVEPIEIRVDCPSCKIKGQKKAKPLDEEDWRSYIEIEGGQRFINELGSKVLEEMKEEKGLDKLPPREPPYWYPKDVKFFGDEPRRNYKRGITHPYQMFSRRNLIALSILLHNINEITDEKIRDKMRFAFTGALFFASLQRKWQPFGKQGGTRSGTLYIPSIIEEHNVLRPFGQKVRNIASGMVSIIRRNNVKCFALLNDASNLSEIPANSIDYLFYDPPYGSNINYSELNIMWEAWIGEFTDVSQEILENKYQRKTRERYEHMMADAFNHAYRILKPYRWLTVVYSYSDPSMYRTIQNIAQNAGFMSEGEVLHINSRKKTKPQVDSDRVQQRFLVINFEKPKNDETKRISRSEDIEYDVIRVIQEYLTKHPGQTRDYIYDQVIKQLFTSVQIQKFDLDEILKNFFRKVGDEWYAPGTLLTRRKVKEEGDLFAQLLPEHPEKEIVLQLQEFLRKYGRIPYSELREFYLRKINIPINPTFAL